MERSRSCVESEVKSASKPESKFATTISVASLRYFMTPFVQSKQNTRQTMAMSARRFPLVRQAAYDDFLQGGSGSRPTRQETTVRETLLPVMLAMLAIIFERHRQALFEIVLWSPASHSTDFADVGIKVTGLLRLALR